MATNSSPADPARSPAEPPGSPAGSPSWRGQRVGVLGSARLGEGSPDWAAGAELGQLLAGAGFTVVTGGYGGLMEAVSRGAAGAGGHVIGLPMRSWAQLSPNAWNTELAWADGYPSRLASLLACQALIALPGGVGTLSELAVAWAARQTEPGQCPVVLVGEGWRQLVDAFARHLVIDARDISLVQVVSSPAEAVDAVLGALAQDGATPHPRG